MRRIGCIFLSVLTGIALLSGCGGKKESEVTGNYICYMNIEETTLVKKEYTIPEGSLDDQIGAMLSAMQEKTDSDDDKSVCPKGLSVEGCEAEDTKLELYFGSDYYSMTVDEEVLFRAAIVQSLGQLDGIDYIAFYVDKKPLEDIEGQVVGYMRPDDFVHNIGSSLHSNQIGEFILYFADLKDEKLVEDKTSIRYNSNMSKEKVIMEQLLKGPADDEMAAVIPADTKVLGISVKDHICYVNLDEGFLNVTYPVDPNLIVYSIVDSMIANSVANQVQISVNGKTDIKYMDMVDLSKPLEFRRDFIKE